MQFSSSTKDGQYYVLKQIEVESFGNKVILERKAPKFETKSE